MLSLSNLRDLSDEDLIQMAGELTLEKIPEDSMVRLFANSDMLSRSIGGELAIRLKEANIEYGSLVEKYNKDTQS